MYGTQASFICTSPNRPDVERIEIVVCLYRAEDGSIRERPWPRGEPDRDTMTGDLYALSYTVTKGLFGPARVTQADISILNSPRYRPDFELELAARERLLRAIVEKEGPAVVQASGGEEAIRQMIGADTFWLDRKAR